MTRKWKNRISVMNTVKLILIDEIHVLGESSRGACIEAVVSRMKAYSNNSEIESEYEIQSLNDESKIRFIAVSATIPNIEDFATWLSTNKPKLTPALQYKMNDTLRPVKLEKFVYGYHQASSQNDFLFDMSLSYKVADIIAKHSNSKPVLVFCATRKSVEQAAKILASSTNYIKHVDHKRILHDASQKIKEANLTNYLLNHGIGFHHAGLDTNDRQLVESLFLNGYLPVLCIKKF
jgi:ATP-dependent DNA helicase HFM1/MER3